MLKQQPWKREGQLGMARAFKTSEPTFSDIPPLTKLLILPKSYGGPFLFKLHSKSREYIVIASMCPGALVFPDPACWQLTWVSLPFFPNINQWVWAHDPDPCHSFQDLLWFLAHPTKHFPGWGVLSPPWAAHRGPQAYGTSTFISILSTWHVRSSTMKATCSFQMTC